MDEEIRKLVQQLMQGNEALRDKFVAPPANAPTPQTYTTPQNLQMLIQSLQQMKGR